MSLYPTKIIELFGLPRTGKTTTAPKLQQTLENGGLKTFYFKEQDNLSPIADKLNPDFNIWRAVSFMNAYIHAAAGKADIMIADRGFLDSMVFENALMTRRYQASQRRLSKQGLLSFEKNYCTGFFFDAPITEVVKRNGKSGTVINNNVLFHYRESFDDMLPKLEEISPIVKVDSGNNHINAVTEFVCQTAQRILKI